jgi:hypothetical protein
MAKSDSTLKNRTKSAANPSASAPKPRARRASQRATAISINLRERSLRDLMIEQCKNGSGYITVYHGSRAELLAAGVPDAAFPTEGAVAEFPVRAANAAEEMLTGSMRSTATGFELEIDWGTVVPYERAHPAVAELARMLLKDVGNWYDGSDLVYPINEVAADPRAVDYKPRPGAPRLQVTAEFVKQLSDAAMNLFWLVHTNCEVLPRTDTAAKHPPRPSFLRLAVDNDSATRVQP